MANIVRFDNGANPNVKFTLDDVAITITIATLDDVGGAAQSIVITNAQAQRAVQIARGSRGGVVELDAENGLIWSIAPDNSSVVTVEKDAATPQQVALTAAQTEACIGWLVADLPQVVDT